MVLIQDCFYSILSNQESINRLLTLYSPNTSGKMSNKFSHKSRKKGFGKATKPAKLIRQQGLVMMDRASLLDTLRKIKESEEQEFVLHSPNHHINGKKICVMEHQRHSRKAVPVSIFHDPIEDKALYSPLSIEEFQIVNGMRVFDQDGNLVKSVDASKYQVGYTMFNTFYLDLSRIDELEEMLPYKEPTLDELIYLGIMDESHTPLTKEEMKHRLGYVVHLSCGGDWKKINRLYETSTDEDGAESVLIITYSDGGEVYYQPQKTRRAWKQNVMSIPAYFDKEGMVRLPSFARGNMSTAV